MTTAHGVHITGLHHVTNAQVVNLGVRNQGTGVILSLLIFWVVLL